MDEAVKKLKKLIESSEKILVTSHISPDPDAVCSLLLLGTTLAHNFRSKEVAMAMEELPKDYEFLTGYKDIICQPLRETVAKLNPDLIVIVDAMNFSRCSLNDAEDVRQINISNGTKLAIIDHHEPVGVEENDSYINGGSPAAVQEVYEVCFDKLGLKKPEGYGPTAMLGLYSDTGGFVYDNPRHHQTFRMVDELLDSGVSIERIKNRLERYSEGTIKALAQLMANSCQEDDHTRSHITDEFISNWSNEGYESGDVHEAVGLFANHYLRNIDGREWGYIVYRDLSAGEDIYGVSFRAVGGTKDVAAIANQLGGGGHKPAAGAKFSASTIEEAMAKIKQAIEASR